MFEPVCRLSNSPDLHSRKFAATLEATPQQPSLVMRSSAPKKLSIPGPDKKTQNMRHLLFLEARGGRLVEEGGSKVASRS